MYHLSTVLPYFTTNVTYIYVISEAAVRLVQASPWRIAIYFRAQTGTPLNLYPPIIDQLYNPQLVVQANDQLKLTWMDDGHLPTLEWWGAAQSPPGQDAVTITEIFWKPP